MADREEATLSDLSGIIRDIEKVGARFAGVGVECNFTEPLVRDLKEGEITLSEAAERIRGQASQYGRAGGALARLCGRVRATANREQKQG